MSALKSGGRHVALLTGLAAGGILTMPPMTAKAQIPAATLRNITTFDGDNSGGILPNGPLLQIGDGSFLGTTTNGGTYGYGTVYRVSPLGTANTLYSFANGSDGLTPFGGLVPDGSGSYYGTTSGFDGLPEGPHNGTVFRYSFEGVLTTLHQFDNVSAYRLVQGKDGNFYGVTTPQVQFTGTIFPARAPSHPSAVFLSDYGSVFRITPTGDFTALYKFTGSDGQSSAGGLVQGSDGNFYGVTRGSAQAVDTPAGTVFRITPQGTLTTVYAFQDNGDGAVPSGDLVQGSDGNFYGATYASGNDGDTIFRLTPAGVLTTLHTFTARDGRTVSRLTQGSDGNFYGTTTTGGLHSDDGSTYYGFGTAFQITPAGVLTTLYNFSGDDESGSGNGLVQGSNGRFYGTTPLTSGSSGNVGKVFALTVSTQPAFFTGEETLTRGAYYLALPNGNPFGYYAFLDDARYLYHFDLGYEYVFDANDGHAGVYLYDFKSGGFFYTSPSFPFPYLYDFSLNSAVYYYPDSNSAGRYTSGPRYFYYFAEDRIITK